MPRRPRTHRHGHDYQHGAAGFAHGFEAAFLLRGEIRVGERCAAVHQQLTLRPRLPGVMEQSMVRGADGAAGCTMIGCGW